MKTTDLTPLDSNMIEAAGYDEATETLTVRFRKNGATWEYPGVPKETAEAFLKSASAGAYFNGFIKSKYGEHARCIQKTRKADGNER